MVLLGHLATKLARGAQRLVLRTEQTPLRELWSRLYAALIYLVAATLARADADVAVYVKGSLSFDEPVFGLSDIDMIAVAAVDDTHRKERVQHAWRRLCSTVPVLPNLVYLFTYDEAELREAVSGSCFTYSLHASHDKAAFLGNKPVGDDMNLLDRPGPFGPTHGWRHIRGPDPVPHDSPHDPQEDRIAAWLELQMWSRYLYAACADPARPYNAYLCMKLVVEPVRLLLWLEHGKKIIRRSEVLEDALRVFPEEEEALRSMQSLRAALPRSPEPPLEQVLPIFLRLCARVADLLISEADKAGSSKVELLEGGADDLAVLPGTADSLRVLAGQGPAPELLPLVDWRALVVSSLPDETCALLHGDALSPAFLGTAALVGQKGAYPLFQVGRLLLLPATAAPSFTAATDRRIRLAAWGRGKLRAIQCPVTDPVTDALVRGASNAAFPNVPGWCARDVARRAVAEHRAWLELERDGTPPSVRAWIEPQEPSTTPTIRSLARLLTAARAALFLGSVEQGEPQLALTLAAVVEQLAVLKPDARSIAEEALGAYRACRLRETNPDGQVVEALRRAVGTLDSYAR